MPKIAKFLLNRKESRIPFTQEGYDKMVGERAALEKERPDAVEHLRKAREMGDLSENGYYKASRQRLTFIDARLRRLANILKRAKIVHTANTGFIDIGSTVTLQVKGTEITYSIVGGYESNPIEHSISHISPLGKSLMGKRAGDTVEVKAPAGVMTYTVVSVS